MDALRELWAAAGLEAIETWEISVQRMFADFEDFWTTSLLSSSIGSTVAAMAAADVEQLKQRVRARLPADAAGRTTCGAYANAIRATKPK